GNHYGNRVEELLTPNLGLENNPRAEQKDAMKNAKHPYLATLFVVVLASSPSATAADKNIGGSAKPMPDAEVIIDGSRVTLDAKWTYWEGPGFASSLPIKWKIVDDPVDNGQV